jgi:hypothetical protein
MESFLSGLGSKLAEKWLATLVLPGLLFVGIGAAAVVLRDSHAVDPARLVRRAADISDRLRAHGPSAILLTLAAAALLATTAALAATWLGAGILQLWLRAWPGPLARWLTGRRQRRWTQADEALTGYEEEIRESGARPAMRDRLAQARNDIALAYPARPTWMGDRTYGVDVRAWHSHGLDLRAVWPRLWLLTTDAGRADVAAARAALDRATTLVGWGVLYVALGTVWWPAALAGLVVGWTGWYRARASTATFADLVEAVVDLNAHRLAVAVGAIRDTDAFTRDVGLEVTRRVRKGT